MTPRRASIPPLMAGLVGLVFGVFSMTINTSIIGLLAGAFALLAGLLAAGIGRRLDEQAEVQRLIEQELRTVRGEAKATEADLRQELEASRIRLEQANRDEDFDASLPAPGLDPLTDDLTGLFSESFFGVALDSRVAAARRHLRPVAVILIEVVEGLPADAPEVTDATIVAEAISATLRESDTACRLEKGEFALLLEDTPENGAIWTVERIRRHLAEHNPNLTLWAGVACYPAHAFSPDDLLTAADAALISAREWRQDRIEVALVASD
ncbi:MAG: GGDEF domain-containing protein [Actinomycetota bacterium]